MTDRFRGQSARIASTVGQHGFTMNQGNKATTRQNPSQNGTHSVSVLKRFSDGFRTAWVRRRFY